MKIDLSLEQVEYLIQIAMEDVATHKECPHTDEEINMVSEAISILKEARLTHET